MAKLRDLAQSVMVAERCLEHTLADVSAGKLVPKISRSAQEMADCCLRTVRKDSAR
jgi:hypothetical protein